MNETISAVVRNYQLSVMDAREMMKKNRTTLSEVEAKEANDRIRARIAGEKEFVTYKIKEITEQTLKEAKMGIRLLDIVYLDEEGKV